MGETGDGKKRAGQGLGGDLSQGPAIGGYRLYKELGGWGGGRYLGLAEMKKILRLRSSLRQHLSRGEAFHN